MKTIPGRCSRCFAPLNGLPRCQRCDDEMAKSPKKAFRPTKEWVLGLKVGDLAPDCFGKLSRVVRIFCRGTNFKGQPYVGFYTEWGDGGSVSGTATAGEVIPTVPLTNLYRTMDHVPEPYITSDINDLMPDEKPPRCHGCGDLMPCQECATYEARTGHCRGCTSALVDGRCPRGCAG